jgi:dynein heavy chain, axonemal
MTEQAFTTIEKSLNAYLDTKKLAFPRFFFLSNDELLEILSETKDPRNVQPFVKKCFEAVQSLAFDSNTLITGCASIEGETIAYDAPVDPKGESNGVEQWLLRVRSLIPHAHTTQSPPRATLVQSV